MLHAKKQRNRKAAKSLRETVFLRFAGIILYYSRQTNSNDAKAFHVLDRGYSTGTEYRTA